MTLRESPIPNTNRIDASALSLESLIDLSGSQLAHVVLESEVGPVNLDDLFHIDTQPSNTDSSNEQRLIISGDLECFDHLCRGTKTGTTVLIGSVGDDFAREQSGGVIIVDGSVGQRAFADKREGLCLIGGNAGERFGCPLPGKLQGIQGGDAIVLGNLGNRACERMRRGVVCVAGDIGQHLAHQWIAGTILALQDIGPYWATHMRRGSLIMQTNSINNSGATLSKQRPIELSFLPILWKHLQGLLVQFSQCEDLSENLKLQCGNLSKALPNGRQVLRCVGDLECEGQGEVLVLQQ